MSAVNVVVEKDAVHLLTDGAGALGKRYYASVTKVYPLAHMNTVVAARGSRWGINRIVDWIQINCASFDELYEKVGRGDLAKSFRFLKFLLPRLFTFQICIAGISESTGEAKAFLFFSGFGGKNYPLWTRLDVPWFFVSPDDGNLAQTFEAAIRGGTHGGKLTLAFMNLIYAQRAASAGKRCVVGGFGQVTTIRRGRAGGSWIETQIIRKWNEKRLAVIDPELPLADILPAAPRRRTG